PPGATPGHPPIREDARRISPAPRRCGRGHYAQPQPTSSPDAHRVARGGSQTARLERPIALSRLHAATRGGALSAARDAERLLGAAHVRVTAGHRREGGGAVSTPRSRRRTISPRGTARLS